MISQRGSVLAGVMGLSLVLTLAGMSYIMVLSHSQSQEENLLREIRLRNAAESALLIGTRYAMEEWDSAFYVQFNPSTPTYDITPGWIEMEGARVEMELNKGYAPVHIICRATLPDGSDTLKLTWAVNSTTAATATTIPQKPASKPFMARLVLKDRTDSIFPYRRSP